jgi:hypothetical protein
MAQFHAGKRSYYWWLVISDALGVPIIEPKILATMVSCEYLKSTPRKQLVMKT